MLENFDTANRRILNVGGVFQTFLQAGGRLRSRLPELLLRVGTEGARELRRGPRSADGFLADPNPPPESKDEDRPPRAWRGAVANLFLRLEISKSLKFARFLFFNSHVQTSLHRKRGHSLLIPTFLLFL